MGISQRPKKIPPIIQRWPLTEYRQLGGGGSAAGHGEGRVLTDVESGREQGGAGEDRGGVDQAERCERAGGERVDACEEAIEPQRNESLGDHDAHLQHDAEPRQGRVVGQVVQGRLGVVSDVELVAHQQVAEHPGDGQPEVAAGR